MQTCPCRALASRLTYKTSATYFAHTKNLKKDTSSNSCFYPQCEPRIPTLDFYEVLGGPMLTRVSTSSH